MILVYGLTAICLGLLLVDWLWSRHQESKKEEDHSDDSYRGD